MDQEITTAQPAPLEPVILVPPKADSIEAKHTKRGFMGTLGLLMAGWLLGNLIFFSVLSTVVIGVAGSSGLVKVPLLTSMLFGNSNGQNVSFDEYSLQSAQEKISEVGGLKKDLSIKTLSFTEDEINALLDKQIKTTGANIYRPYLKLLDNKFIFTGKLVSTNAPVYIEGNLDVSSLTARVGIESAKFGKIDMPSFIASNIIEANFLNKLGFSLSSSDLPAESLKLTDGLLTLEGVKNPNP